MKREDFLRGLYAAFPDQAPPEVKHQLRLYERGRGRNLTDIECRKFLEIYEGRPAPPGTNAHDAIMLALDAHREDIKDEEARIEIERVRRASAQRPETRAEYIRRIAPYLAHNQKFGARAAAIADTAVEIAGRIYDASTEAPDDE